jgi:hypothetical protein
MRTNSNEESSSSFDDFLSKVWIAVRNFITQIAEVIQALSHQFQAQ